MIHFNLSKDEIERYNFLFNQKHIIYIDTINKQYRIANPHDKAHIFNIGDIFTIFYNSLRVFEESKITDIEDIDYSTTRELKYMNTEDLINSINNNSLCPELKRFIKMNNTQLIFKLGVYKDKPIFYCDCLLGDLLLYDLIALINDKNINIKICKNCKRLFKKDSNNQKWCKDCLDNDPQHKQYQHIKHLEYNKIDTPNYIKLKIRGRLNKRYEYDKLNPYYLYMSNREEIDKPLGMIYQYDKDYEALNKLNAFDLMREYIFPVYARYIVEQSSENISELEIKRLIDNCYDNMFKCNDILTLEAYFIDIFKHLPNRECKSIIKDISDYALNNSVIKDFSKKAIVSELSDILNQSKHEDLVGYVNSLLSDK